MIRVRRVAINEFETLRDLAEKTFRLAFESQNDPVYFAQYCQEAFAVEEILAELSHPESEFWYIFFNNDLAGYLKINFDQSVAAFGDDPVVQVERLYILPEFQGKKMGETLLTLADRRAHKQGSHWIWLTVWEKNPAAVRFYQRHGYEQFDTTIFQIGDDAQTDLLMRKKVNRLINN